MTSKDRQRQVSIGKALDIGNSWREVAHNCHVDPDAHECQPKAADGREGGQ